MNTVTLYRPVGTEELTLIRDSNWREFPPRLPEQPIFYPVTNEGYARQIARDWNAQHSADRRGYVLRFEVRAEVAYRYERKIVGSREHEEMWVPAEDLEFFNDAIVGEIVLIAEYGPGGVEVFADAPP